MKSITQLFFILMLTIPFSQCMDGKDQVVPGPSSRQVDEASNSSSDTDFDMSSCDSEYSLDAGDTLAYFDKLMASWDTLIASWDAFKASWNKFRASSDKELGKSIYGDIPNCLHIIPRSDVIVIQRPPEVSDATWERLIIFLKQLPHKNIMKNEVEKTKQEVRNRLQKYCSKLLEVVDDESDLFLRSLGKKNAFIYFRPKEMRDMCWIMVKYALFPLVKETIIEATNI
ncbi:hypothetical protein BdWA1_000298 [Babesia duncani]|uniref:Uncharacterized protein n=1 Tax=Babesia duncani TaxID=323732 RepID=A0AAD9PM59_9APIC|nr:hypothetical protein BdWA1_000298 [Babesia duncani]